MKRKDFNDYYTTKRPHFGLMPSAWIAGLTEKLDAGEGRRCLDLGCGHGRNALYLAKRGFEVTAVDSSPPADAHRVQVDLFPNQDRCTKSV